jgi:hypothetical protein
MLQSVFNLHSISFVVNFIHDLTVKAMGWQRLLAHAAPGDVRFARQCAALFVWFARWFSLFEIYF